MSSHVNSHQLTAYLHRSYFGLGSRVWVSCVIGNVVRGVCNWIRKLVTPPSVTTHSSQPTSRGSVGPRKHFIIPSIHRFGRSTWDIVVCLFSLYVHVLCKAIFSYIQNKTAMMLSLGIKTHTSYMGIDVMSSECSSQSRILLFANLIYYY